MFVENGKSCFVAVGYAGSYMNSKLWPVNGCYWGAIEMKCQIHQEILQFREFCPLATQAYSYHPKQIQRFHQQQTEFD